ncbi:hypothetical protein CANARDRAFT_30340 [[Candida] arabinofermentans NRRL YB-2248]|uniref:DUF4484 domain-containing protein n=1 Tax=[Candida] arabinofermentans NRRL YB-2248 TaxID=983967 RepID=A0A1E4SU79_9ASCO|nr:hypothetical protein CANARDRAFT_30340 [[Candida] arabinofermentans NRRL YB-2248]
MDSETTDNNTGTPPPPSSAPAKPSASQTQLPPIAALFLSKFDVHTGYDLKWYRSLNSNTYSSKGLEFKSLPSGLHSVSNDVICFTQEKCTEISTGASPDHNLIYGMSIYRQNKQEQQLDTNTGAVDRDQVKMYSLGILIDPAHLSDAGTPVTWKPKFYSACWGYRSDLDKLLSDFMTSDDSDQEDLFCDNFEQYYEIHKFRGPNDLTNKFKDIMKSVNINRRKSIQTLINEELNTNESNASITENGTSAATSVSEPSIPKCDSALYDVAIDDEHMISGLLPLLEKMGPLIFKIWKLSLLRKKIILYSPQQASTFAIPCDDGSHDVSQREKRASISDFSKFIYCISLISSIPKEIRLPLIKSGVVNLDDLEFNTPLYNICVNDISFIKSIKNGFLASTTDQIILEKCELYDYSLKLESINLMNHINEDCTCDDDDLIPKIARSGDKTREAKLATSRDFQRYKLLYWNFFSESNVEDSIGFLNKNEIDNQEISLPQYAKKTTEPVSVREFFWKAFSWWATAGGMESKQDEYEIEFALFDDLSKDEIEKLVSLLGYFQKLTIKLFNLLIDIVNNSESDHLNEQNLDENSIDPESTRVNGSENEPLVPGAPKNERQNSGKTIWIESQDVYEMGLDPYSSSDCEFLIELISVWWGKEAKIGGYLGNMCCI